MTLRHTPGMENFDLFLIILPGLEDLALAEMTQKCPTKKIKVHKGGIEVSEVNLRWIEEAHTLLKIPTRILMRITEFKVRDFPKLYQKFSNFLWQPYLSHPHPQWSITCSESRLNHTGRIEETITQALNEALKRQPLSRDWEKKNYPPQVFYIRLHQDLLTLSLDLTGEPLYKRGMQTIKGEAPLRENIASALIFETLKDTKHPVTLIDPMCGSGTFLVEALCFHRPLHLRPFAFETAPFYKGKLLRLPPEATPFLIEKALGQDINGDLISKLKVDLPIEFKLQDSLTTTLPKDAVVICNPPYGERIKISGKKGHFLTKAWEHLLNQGPLRFAWLIPSDMDDLFPVPSGYQLLKKRSFRNGGLPVTFWLWEKL